MKAINETIANAIVENIVRHHAQPPGRVQKCDLRHRSSQQV